jgi:hypothetical protein
MFWRVDAPKLLVLIGVKKSFSIQLKVPKCSNDIFNNKKSQINRSFLCVRYTEVSYRECNRPNGIVIQFLPSQA